MPDPDCPSPAEPVRMDLPEETSTFAEALAYIRPNKLTNGDAPVILKAGMLRCCVSAILMREADLVSRLSAAEAGREEAWRPIATAPKDGKPFLAAHDQSGVRQITWFGKTSHVPLYGWAVCPDGDPEEVDLWSPTHWMPLPEPPAFPDPSRPALKETTEGAS